jgi:hypothetical protein
MVQRSRSFGCAENVLKHFEVRRGLPQDGASWGVEMDVDRERLPQPECLHACFTPV